jgi:hypothetical protein
MPPTIIDTVGSELEPEPEPLLLELEQALSPPASAREAATAPTTVFLNMAGPFRVFVDERVETEPGVR